MSDTTGTTEFIRRRIYHWKTTIAGVATIIAPIVLILVDHNTTTTEKILAGLLALSGTGHVLSADGSTVGPQIVRQAPPSNTCAPPRTPGI